MAATKPGKAPAWGRWLEIHRRERKLSQRKLAELSGGAVSAAQIQRWETGAEATVDDVVNTCAALGVPVTEFLVAAGYLNPDALGIPVRYPTVVGMPKRDLIAHYRALGDEIAARIPDDQTGDIEDLARADSLTPFRRRIVPVVTPEGEEGSDWAALDRKD